MTETYSGPTPEAVENAGIEFNVIETTFENKKKQRALKSATPEQWWRLRFAMIDDEELAELFNFYVARSGSYEAFYWYHPYEYTTLTNTEAAAATVLEVSNTMRLMVGDVIRLNSDNAEIHTITAISLNVSITIGGGGLNGQVVSGSRVEPRYTVHFGEAMDWETVKVWARQIGILFKRHIA